MMRKLLSALGAITIVFSAVLALVSLASSPANAQNAYGSIVGTVTDTSGAAVPGTRIMLVNIGTNNKKTILADDAGNYRFVNLPPTQYRLEFEQKNYKHVIQSPVTVQVDSVTRADVLLQVGETSETVEVTTQAPLLQTESGTLGSQVEGKTVEQMPLNGRNTTNLISLVPGVVPQGSSMGNTTMNSHGTHTNNAGWGNYQIGGGLSSQGTMYFDGAPLNGLVGNYMGFVPTQDAVQEFKVGTNSVSAEFGRFGGGVVEMSSKSGTNAFHGSAYEYLRNTVLNANTWGATSKQSWIQNQFGLAVGGPILRDKDFFFFSWEKFVSRSTALTTGNIPDTGMMDNTAPSVPGNLLANSKLTLPASQQNCLSYNATTNRTVVAQSCLDPMAQIFKKYFKTATTVPGSYNYSYLAPIGNDNSQYNARGDVNLTANQRLFARYSYFTMSDISMDGLQSANGFLTGNGFSKYPTHQAAVGDTITLNPKTIADVRLSYMRQYFNDLTPSMGVDLASKYGFNSNWATINRQQTIATLPLLAFSGGYNLYFHGQGKSLDMQWENTYALSASMTRIQGAHTLKFGGEGRLMDLIGVISGNPGVLAIDNTTYTMNEWANFLLGDLNNFTFAKTARVASYNWYQSYYATDTWNATRKLTVTAGLRWELPGGMAERRDRATVMLPDVDQTVNGTNVHGILALVKTGNWGDRSIEPVKHNLFSPRIGLAYRLNDKTVLRAGYALLYLPSTLSQNMYPPYSTINQASTTSTNPNNTTVYYTVANPFGAGTANAVNINQPTGRSDSNFLAKFANISPSLQAVTGVVPTTKFPYMQQWNLTAGREFFGQQSLDVTYAGAVGIHLPAVGYAGWGLDQLNTTYAAQLQAGTITTAQAQALRPYPAYKNFTDYNAYVGTMTYHALQARYQKRLGTGMVNSGYTFSKSIGDTDSTMSNLDSDSLGLIQNYNNIKVERSLLSYSIAQRWVTSYILDLPFGKGKKWANSLNGTLDRIVGGWSVNGITTFQSGQPLGLSQSNNAYANNFGAGKIRPNTTAGCSKLTNGSAQSRLSSWFDKSCYTVAGNYQLGNEPRVDSKLRAAGIANWDFVGQKVTRVTESTSLQFRVEFFNVFNRRQFSNPGVNISSGSAFGVITSQQNNPRQIQASLRFNF